MQAAMAAADCQFVLANHEEAGLLIRTSAAASYLDVPSIAFRAKMHPDLRPEQLALWFDMEFQQWSAAGKRVLLSPATIEALRTFDQPLLPVLAAHVEARYDLARATNAMFYTVQAK